MGSPLAPISFVLSKTAIFFAVFGKAFMKYFAEKGLYKCTEINPTFSPLAMR